MDFSPLLQKAVVFPFFLLKTSGHCGLWLQTAFDLEIHAGGTRGHQNVKLLVVRCVKCDLMTGDLCLCLWWGGWWWWWFCSIKRWRFLACRQIQSTRGKSMRGKAFDWCSLSFHMMFPMMPLELTSSFYDWLKSKVTYLFAFVRGQVLFWPKTLREVDTLNFSISFESSHCIWHVSKQTPLPSKKKQFLPAQWSWQASRWQGQDLSGNLVSESQGKVLLSLLHGYIEVDT